LVDGGPGLRVLSGTWLVVGSVTQVNRACWLLGLAADVKLAFVGGGSGC